MVTDGAVEKLQFPYPLLRRCRYLLCLSLEVPLLLASLDRLDLQ